MKKFIFFFALIVGQSLTISAQTNTTVKFLNASELAQLSALNVNLSEVGLSKTTGTYAITLVKDNAEPTSILLVNPINDSPNERLTTNMQLMNIITTTLIVGGITLIAVGIFTKDPNSNKISPLIPIGAVVALSGIVPFIIGDADSGSDNYAHK